MIKVSEIYDDVALDCVNSYENGELSYSMFNRLSKRAELRMLNYLSGDIENIKPPMPYNNQLLKDILAPFIEKYFAQVLGGIITRPKDYYSFDSMVLLGDYAVQSNCDDDNTDVVQGCNTTIYVLSSDVFDMRCKTYIEGLSPSFKKPITKQVGRNFEFMPVDIGSVVLQYIRYPKFAKIVVSPNRDVYNNEVIDEALCIDYEYDEFAREMLIFWITQEYGVSSREQALLQANQLEGKSARL